MILVTGGTGLVGAHLLLKLTIEGKQVRAIYRRAHKIELVKNLFLHFNKDNAVLFDSIEWVEANLNDIPKLQQAFKNVSEVYHCAAFVSFEPDKYKTLRKINIEGTANIVNLCISNTVKKLCYVSSIAAIGQKEKNADLINENTAWNPETDNSVYAITKYGAEMEVWRGSQEGIDVLVVNPGIIIGGGYWKSGSSGSLFTKLYKGSRYYTLGVTGYVSAKDVVNVMYLLMSGTYKNQGYILVSENLSFKTFQDYVCDALGVSAPSKEAKPWLLQLAWRLDWLQHKLFGKRRQLTKQLATSAIEISKYDNSKVKNALNYEFEPIQESINEVAEWFLSDKTKLNS